MFCIPDQLGTTHRRLCNWGSWARGGRPIGRAKSIEGRFIRDSVLDKEHHGQRRPQLDVDVFDASLVDRTIAPAGGFEQRLSALLKHHYVFKAGTYELARLAKIPPRKVSGEFERALFTVQYLLQPPYHAERFHSPLSLPPFSPHLHAGLFWTSRSKDRRQMPDENS